MTKAGGNAGFLFFGGNGVGVVGYIAATDSTVVPAQAGTHNR
jgi:hypothetical protein